MIIKKNIKPKHWVPLGLLLFTTNLFAAPVQPDSPAAPAAGSAMPDIRDIKDVITLPPVNPLWFWACGGVLCLILLLTLLVYLKKRRKKVQVQRAHEKALQALEDVRSLMTPDNARTFAISLADILRKYIENRFQLSMRNLTTREFLQVLVDAPETTPKELQTHDTMLGNWLNQCDLVKFAQYALTQDEMEQMFDSVSQFVTTTRHEDTQS